MELAFSPCYFEDVDQFSEWEIELGWNIESTQLSYGANEIGFDHFAFPELLAGHYHMKQSMQNVFEVPDGVAVLVLCRAKLPKIWCCRQFPPSLLSILRSGHEHLAVLPAGWDCYEFMIAEELIYRTELFPPEFYAKTTCFDRAFLPLVEPETGQFIKGLDGFFQRARSASPLEAEVRKAELYEFMISGLQQVIDVGLAASTLQTPHPTRRPELVAIAKDFMAENLQADLTADEIAQHLGVSYRVLNYAFQDTLGISPYRSFLTEKLHAVRRMLMSSDVSVTEASVSYGFYTPSRFTRQYKRLFGEFPSETSSRKPHLVNGRALNPPISIL